MEGAGFERCGEGEILGMKCFVRVIPFHIFTDHGFFGGDAQKIVFLWR